MADRIDVQKTYKIYIGGEFVRTESGRYYPVTEPKSGKLIANLCLSSRKDFRNAVVAARKAQPGWAGRSAYNRSQILYRIAEMMEGRRDQFVAELKRSGYSAAKASKEIDTSIDRMVYFAGWCDKYQQIYSTVNPVAGSYFNFSVPEPTGVISVVAPEDQPLAGLVSVVAPVIAGGNTCVVLCSEKSPLTAVTFSEVLHSSDVPGGVINLLTGQETELVEHFSSHMDVNAVIYARSHKDNLKRIQENASLNVKRVVVRNEKDWTDAKHENPYTILDTLEIKTTWHPIGV
ncbi:MAG: aldehyde dehydrogenase family protein [Balneolaceae bacterium]|nr:MAG: aldehyde dehydrogenase family protein [Balneolaceae bacterium]